MSSTTTSTTNPFNNSTVTVSNTGTTSNGNKIVTSGGGDMDKNAFLKILAAEMSNLDPSQNQDSTAYVTQMAQFAGIEQMNNLNSTITKGSYQQLLGKNVVMTDTDSSGNPYTGLVKGVTTDSSGNNYLNLSVTQNGQSTNKTFKADDVSGIIDSSDSVNSSSAATALNTGFLAASALKGQNVVVSTTDSSNSTVNVSGTIESAYINNGAVMIKITASDGTTKEYPYSSVVQTGDSASSSTSSATSA